jgi:hypothetical protein
MCTENLRCYNFCKTSPNHGYWQIDRCVISYRNGGIPCETRQQIPPAYLPAPIGVECCPYAGCSDDFRHQRVDPTATGGGNREWRPLPSPVKVRGNQVKYQR